MCWGRHQGYLPDVERWSEEGDESPGLSSRDGEGPVSNPLLSVAPAGPRMDLEEDHVEVRVQREPGTSGRVFVVPYNDSFSSPTSRADVYKSRVGTTVSTAEGEETENVDTVSFTMVIDSLP